MKLLKVLGLSMLCIFGFHSFAFAASVTDLKWENELTRLLDIIDKTDKPRERNMQDFVSIFYSYWVPAVESLKPLAGFEVPLDKQEESMRLFSLIERLPIEPSSRLGLEVGKYDAELLNKALELATLFTLYAEQIKEKEAATKIQKFWKGILASRKTEEPAAVPSVVEEPKEKEVATPAVVVAKEKVMIAPAEAAEEEVVVAKETAVVAVPVVLTAEKKAKLEADLAHYKGLLERLKRARNVPAGTITTYEAKKAEIQKQLGS